MKCAIIGCGRIAVNHVKAVANNDLDLVALCDIDDSKFDIMLEKAGCGDFPEAERYADYHQMLEEHPEIELYAQDGQHASMDGSVLAAQVIYETLFLFSFDRCMRRCSGSLHCPRQSFRYC